MPNKFITNLDLARQAEIFSGETAVFKGGMQLGIPFSGFPTGVDTSTITSLGVVDTQFAVFSGNTGTTVFNVTDPSSPYYSVSATTLSTSPYTVIDVDTIVETISATTYPTIMSFTAVTGSNGATLGLSFSQPILETLNSSGQYTGLFSNLGGVSIGTTFNDESFYNVGSVFSGANINMEVVTLGAHASTPAWSTGTTSGTVVEYSALTQYWTDPTIIAYTSGLTLPITPESADTQTSDYIWTLTDSTVIDENLVGIKYTGYSITYSFNNLSVDPTSPSVTGATGTTSADTYYYGSVVATFENFSAGTLDYKGSTNWLTIDGRATVEERFTTDRMTILNPDTGSSVSTLGLDVDGKVVTYIPTTTSEVTGLTFNNTTYDLSLGLDNGTSFTDNLGILASDIKVTGGTYDNATGEMTFVNNSGGSFVISGLTTGSTLQEVLDNGNTATLTGGGTFDTSYTFDYNLNRTTISGSTYKSDFVQNTNGFNLNGYQNGTSKEGSMVLNWDNVVFRYENVSGDRTELYLHDNTGGSGDAIMLVDNIYNRGAIYGADYSSNFIDESLVTKRYVDDSISGFVETSLFNTYTGDTETVLNSKLNITDFNTYSGSVQTQIDGKTNNTEFTSHTGDTTIHFTKSSINLSDLGSSAHTHTLSEITDFNSYSGNVQTQIDSKIDLTLFNSHTGDTNNPHQTSFSNLTSTAHTHTLSDITDFNTYSGSVQTQIDGKVETTLFNTYTGNTETTLNSKIETATNVGSGEGLFSGKSGTDLQFKTLTSTGATVTITDEGDTINLESSGVGSVWTGSTNVATYNGDNSLETAIKLVNSASGVGVNDGLIIGIQSSNTYFINKESGYIVFRTRPSFTDVDRLKIYNDGTVQVVRNSGGLVIGDGTSTTPATMGVYGTSGNAHFSSGTYGYTTNDGMFVGIGTGADAHGYAWVKENLPFIIKTDDTERLRVKGDGDVGIGFPNYNDGTAINSRLHVRGEGNTSATTTLTIENFDGTSLLSVKDDGTVNISNIGSTTPVTNLAVDASGNVVSGTTGGGGGSGIVYIASGTTSDLLDDTNNWDINGEYTGTTITGTLQGYAHYNSDYWFTAVDDNNWIRLIRG